MSKHRLRGVSILIAALLLCACLLMNSGTDRYSVVYKQSEFRTEYLAGYTGESTALNVYVGQSADAVKCFSLGPLCLEPGDYEMELSYSAADESSVVKVYASDYVSSDNSGGKIFVNQALDPQQDLLRLQFSLDQQVDSLFLTIETTDSSMTFGRWNLRSTGLIWNDRYFFCLLLLFGAAAALWLINSRRSRLRPGTLLGRECSSAQTRLVLVLTAVFAIFVASIPLFNAQLIYGHDTFFQVARIEGMARALRSGQFPVRVHGGTLNDYGYPNSLFYPELLFYFPALLRLAGISLVNCYKSLFALLNLLTMLCGYLAFARLSRSRFVGMMAAILYLLNPYRLICIYYRSAAGEVAAITFLPLVFYGLYAILYGEKRDWGYLAAGATGVLQSHILTTELTAIFAGCFVLCGARRLFDGQRRWRALVAAAAVVVLLNAWFLVPMVLMMMQLGLSVFQRTQGVGGPLSINRLFYTNTLYAVGPHPVGWIGLFAVPFYLLRKGAAAPNERANPVYRLGDLMLWTGVVCAVGTTGFFPWDEILSIPVIGTMLSSIQFAYRLMSIGQTALCFLVVITLTLWLSDQRARRLAGTVLVCVSVIFAGILYETGIQTDTAFGYDKSHYVTNLDNQMSVGQAEYLVSGNNLDEMVGNLPQIESDNDSFAVTDLARYGTNTSFAYQMQLPQQGQSTITLPITYIPNYEVTVNGEQVQTFKADGGRVAFTVTEPSGSVAVSYQEPLLFRLCELVSLAAAAGLVVAKKKGIFQVIE